jgi:ABC-2 type transport system permease protein
MSWRWLLRKELTWSRHQVLSLVFVLLLLPSTAAFAALGFQHVLPEDTPVAVVPHEETTEDEVNIVVAGLTSFTDPVRYDSRERALAAMDRERVYAVVTVPPGLTNESANVTLTMYRDGNVVPYERPGRAIGNVLDRTLSRAAPADVHVRQVEVGEDRTLSQYLVPTFVMLVVLVLSFGYLPYALVSEAAVLDRIRFRSSLFAAVAGKVATFTVLGVVPLVAAAAASAHLGYGIALLAPGAVLVYVLTLLYTGAFAAGLTVLASFETWGRLGNLVALLFVLGFAGIVYPVGFFSAVRRELVRLVPLHYSMIVARGHVLKGLSVGELSGEYAVLVATTAAALGFMWGSTRLYERRA